MLTFGSLFAGIGGFDLGFERAGMRCLWQVEKDPFCQKVLAKHWPEVERFEDVKEVGKHNLRTVDVICGGFPCQPHSTAGKRKASADERDLWGEFARIVGEVKPRWVVAENVPGLLSSESGRFFGGILRDLAEIGYDAKWNYIKANEFKSPQGRPRLFIIANIKSKQWNARQFYSRPIDKSTYQAPKNWGSFWYVNRGSNNVEFRKEDEHFICGMDDGVPDRVDRLKSLGNAVVPQVAEFIGKLIVEADKEL